MEATPENKNKRSATGCLVAVAFILLAYWLWPASASLEGEAWVMSKDFVRARLVAPATASFGSYDTQRDGNTVTVTGEVDSENSFGATLRKQYTCTLTYTGGEWTETKNWTLQKLWIEP